MERLVQVVFVRSYHETLLRTGEYITVGRMVLLVLLWRGGERTLLCPC